MKEIDYKEKLEKFSKQVILVLKKKSLRGCDNKSWVGFCNGYGEDIGVYIDKLISIAEDNLKK